MTFFELIMGDIAWVTFFGLVMFVGAFCRSNISYRIHCVGVAGWMLGALPLVYVCLLIAFNRTGDLK